MKYSFPYNENTVKVSLQYEGEEYIPLSRFVDVTRIRLCTHMRHFVNEPFAIYEYEC